MKDTRAKDVQAFFERVATDWDTMRLFYYDGRVIEKMAEVSDADEGMTVADVGTGTGFVATGIAPRVARVLAVDNSPAMLGVARKNLAELGISNVELLEGDVTAVPLESGSVDAAFANMVLHHTEDPAAMLREMARVVRPEARGHGRHNRRGGASSHVDARGTRGRMVGVRAGAGRALLRGSEARRPRIRVARDAVMHPFHDLG